LGTRPIELSFDETSSNNAGKMSEIDPILLELASKVTAKRPKTVIDHIIKYGFITTEQLKDVYGYNHPPRAIRDVREQGIPLETFRVEGSDGRRIGAYRFGDPSKIERHKLGGRKVFSKKFKENLIAKYGSRCATTNEVYEARYLQIDHRIPYEVIGDKVAADEENLGSFMLLSGAAQRQKSWSCEHCENLLTLKNSDICRKCYWAFPESYTHVAMREERRVDLMWQGREVETYSQLSAKARKKQQSIQGYIKDVLEEEAGE